jgi:hypothetical protein
MGGKILNEEYPESLRCHKPQVENSISRVSPEGTAERSSGR